MPLAPLTTLLDQAMRGGYGIGYFEAWDGYSLEAVCEAAEEERSPVILGFGCMMADRAWLEGGGLETLAGIGRPRVERVRVPAAFLLNETQTLEQAVKALEQGFNAVMLDTSAMPPATARQALVQLVRLAHAKDVAVEAEVGRLPLPGATPSCRAARPPLRASSASAGQAYSYGELTDPEEAAAFVEATGVDCLAVSIGNVHLLTDGYAPIDMARLEAIRRRVDVPLVIHGGTGFPPEAVPQAVANGVVKFNVGTVLKQVFLEAVREAALGWSPRINVHDVLGSHKEADFLNAGKAAMKTKVKELIRLYGSSDKA